MTHRHSEQLLAHAATAVGEALRLLTTPNAAGLDRCQAEFERARACLEPLGDDLIHAPAGSRARMMSELTGLHQSLRRAQGLLDHAASFWAGWTRLRNALTGGYTAAGGAAEQAAGSRLRVEA